MTAEVIGIHGGADPREPPDDVIEVLEDLLQRARDGRVRAIAYAVFTDEKSLISGWSGEAGTRHPLSSAIAILSQRYTEAMMEPA